MNTFSAMEIDKELDTNVPREDSFFKEVFDAIATSRTIPGKIFSTLAVSRYVQVHFVRKDTLKEYYGKTKTKKLI